MIMRISISLLSFLFISIFHHTNAYQYCRMKQELKELPKKAETVAFRGRKYYFCDGVFYKKKPGDTYEEIATLIGVHIKNLPENCSRINVNGDGYFYDNGVFYMPHGKKNFEIVNPPINAQVRELPNRAREIEFKGEKYFEHQGSFYQKVREGKTVLFVVVDV